MAKCLWRRLDWLPWLLLVFVSCALSSAIPVASPITELRTETVTISQGKPSVAQRWADLFGNIFKSRQAPNCGSGLLSCEVEDPTRLEAPWHGVSAPFPQCYDPAAYICSENFLCPINAPKIQGEYACGPYISSISTQASSESSLSRVSETSSVGTFTSISSSRSVSSGLSSVSLFTSIFSSKTSVSSFLTSSASTLSSQISASSVSSSGISLFSSSSSLSESISSTSSTSQSPGSSQSSTTPLTTSTAETSREIVIGSSTYFLGTGLSTITDDGNTIVLGGSNGVSIVSQSLSMPTSGITVVTTDGMTISVQNPTSIETSSTSLPSSTGSLGSSLSQIGGSSLPSSALISQSSTSSSAPGSTESNISSESSPGSGVSSSQTSLPSSSDTSTPPGSGATSTQTSLPSSIVTSTPPEVVVGGSTYTFPSFSTTLTEPNGQSVILGPSGIVIGTDTIGFPSETSPLAMTTDGLTLTFDPASSSTLSASSASQTSVPEGILIGGSSFPFPSSPTTLREPNGDTVVIGPSGIIIGSDTVSFPTVTTPTVITTDGLTFTLEPGGVNTSPTPIATPSVVFIDGTPFSIGTGFQTITESNGQVLTLGQNGLIFGTDTIPFPAPCSTTTTFAVAFGLPCFTTASIPLSTSVPPSFTSSLPIFTAWPSDAFFSTDTSGAITTGTATSGTHVYVTTTSSGSDGTGAPFMLSVPHLSCFLCGCWFCPPKIPGFNILGSIVPGIYPPPPPKILPPGFSINLPSITIGGNGDPTYSSETDKPTSTDSSTSSSSSSSSCSTATATDCTAFISYGIDQSGSTTTSFTSSQCTTVTACSVTPFTTTSVTSSVAPSGTRVIIFPVEGSSGDQQKAIQDSITQDLEDPSNLFVSSLDGNSVGTLFWKANLTSTQQDALKQNPAVSSIRVEGLLGDINDDNLIADGTSSSRHRRRATYRSIGEDSPSNASIPNHLLWRRDDVSDDANDQPWLKSISQSKDNDDVEQYTQYTYDSTSGLGTTVYVVDTGANPEHNELKNLVPGVRQQNGWLYPGDPKDTRYAATEGDYDLARGHGTCMTGLISSPTYGVAKRAELVIVKTLQDTFSDQTDAFTKVHNDIVEQRAKGVTMRPVINYSRNIFIPGPEETPFADDDVQKLYDAIKQVIDDGAVVLACAGNRGVSQAAINSYPALFGLSDTKFGKQLDLIVIGAANEEGEAIGSSQGGDGLGVYAVGTLVDCPYFEGTSGINEGKTGTSCATALTSGLAAYFWSLTEYQSRIDGQPGDTTSVASRMLTLIEEMAWVRPGGDIPLIWNGKESPWTPSQCSSPDKKKRQGGSASSCSISSSASSSQPPVSVPTGSTASSTDITTTAPPSSSPAPSTAISSTPSTTSTTSSSASPTPTAAWDLVLYNAKCENHNTLDFSYYSLRGFEVQSPNESCISLKHGLPQISSDSNYCSWFTDGGADPSQPCSAGTFDTPTSFSIRNGFCTIYTNDDCTGDSNGIDNSLYNGCTNYDTTKFLPKIWLSMQCFAE